MLALLTVKVWPTIDKSQIDQIKTTASMSMLLLIKSKMVDYLTDGLKNLMIAFGFESVYYTYLSSFYQGKLIPAVNSINLMDMLDYFANNPDHQRRLLYHAFTYGGLEDYAMQKGLHFGFFFLTTCFGRKWIPEISIVPLNTILSHLIALDMDTEQSEESKLEKSTDQIYRLFWYVDQIVIKNKKFIGTYTMKDPAWNVLNWLLDFSIGKEIMKLNFSKYLSGLDYLLHRNLARELEKLGEELESINWEDYQTFEKVNILSEGSNKQVSYLIENIQVLS